MTLKEVTPDFILPSNLAWHTFPSHRKVRNLTPRRLQVKVERFASVSRS